MTITTQGGPIAVLVQIQGYRPAAGTLTYQLGYGTRARGTLTTSGSPTEATLTLYYSDLGYRTSPADAGGVVAYPPYLMESFAIDRKLQLDPGRSWVSVSWGQLRIRISSDLVGLIQNYNSDGRDLSVYMVRKTWDAVRQIWKDPPFTEATLIFKGLAGPWRVSDFDLIVPLRDPSYWLERPAQSSSYTGAGSYGGAADLKDKPIPRARGGTNTYPIKNVKPVLIDPANLIYQYTDGPGTVVALYEGAYAGYTFQADTTNLYAGSTSAGQYRTDNSRGLFQLGTSPVREITADVTGNFPVAGAKTVLGDILRYALTEDMSLPSALLDTTAFTSFASSYNYTAGFWLGSDPPNGSDLASFLMESCAGWLVPGRDGKLRPKVLRVLTGTETPVVALTTAQIVSMSNKSLPAILDPPAYRWRVGYQNNYTVQTNDLSSLITNARKLTVSQPMQVGSWVSTSIASQYRRPNDPSPIGGALMVSTDADAVASGLGNLLSSGGNLYSVVLPASIALGFDLGDILSITYPIERFQGGRLVQVVGESLRLGESQATIEVLG